MRRSSTAGRSVTKNTYVGTRSGVTTPLQSSAPVQARCGSEPLGSRERGVAPAPPPFWLWMAHFRGVTSGRDSGPYRAFWRGTRRGQCVCIARATVRCQALICWRVTWWHCSGFRVCNRYGYSGWQGFQLSASGGAWGGPKCPIFPTIPRTSGFQVPPPRADRCPRPWVDRPGTP